ncbi:uncharacterized protein E0L32_008715 [Thyridium curvatum]|uniref:Xylanolytic transcriptional activator regulatory domain-containing protein n=1 Tax=Thyridium curvatum TaxID=1093900 RepID=A0A507B184_9PEZI|nr:uncharacterized protein E0L32_008715 [Thyridium curvatum]TPX10310.1 hypothetical protein E0L32_008715 [Thyridium curvatum]
MPAMPEDGGRPSSSTDAKGSVLSMLLQELQQVKDLQNTSSYEQEDHGEDGSRTRKRTRVQYEEPSPTTAEATSTVLPLPPPHVLEALIEAYFNNFSPWIPMIHRARFDKRRADVQENEKLLVVLRAMMVAAMRHVPRDNAVGQYWTQQQLEATRSWVISTAMSSLSIENLQALTIIAFNDIGNGEAMRAWSIIGSLTRTVEYLQLTVEREDADRAPLSKSLFSRSQQVERPWVEDEERRRVFWNIFNLDRFCSITMGWNTSLTNNDIRRRLPCDISLWWQDEFIKTPYYNIWDKSEGRIGNPISLLPSTYGGMAQSISPGESATTSGENITLSPAGAGMAINMSTVGAFAYSVEATESLSQVTTYFLQQKFDIRDQREIESWLVRFKELDLRLIHWKMFLPQKWKPDMARQAVHTSMDPNLTLAHITHNTSIILLHQPIAFPPKEWSFRGRLPSTSSAETCYAAAIEVASITANYLRTSSLPVANQFAFCCFISARLLLIHCKYYRAAAEDPPPEFNSLLESLDEISRSWAGFDETKEYTLAAKYAERLRALQKKASQVTHFQIDPSDYTVEISHDSPSQARSEPSPATAGQSFQRPEMRTSPAETSPSKTTVPEAPISHSAQMYFDTNRAFQAPNQGAEMQDMSSISQLFLDQSFVDVDRIISLDDGIFDTGYDGSFSYG